MEDFSLKHYGIFVGVAGFLVGVAFASLGLLWTASAVFLLFLSVIFALYIHFFTYENSTPKTYTLIIFFCVFSALGIIRFTFSTLPLDPDLVHRLGSKTEIMGEVVEEPRVGETYRQYILKTHSGIKILVRANLYPAFSYGDILSGYGKLEQVKAFETPQGVTFDYPAYLDKEGISYVLSFATTKKVGVESHIVQTALFGIKNYFDSAFEKVIPYPQSGLLAGILLGVTDGMGKDMLATFRMVGIIHIVVLSGYNITIVAESIRKSLSFLSLRKGLIAGTIGIIIFSTMVGWTPSVLRASIMAILAIVARASRRKYDVGRALALAAFFMVLWNPKLLLYDLGFQLSFLATIALIWISPKVLKKLNKIPEKFGLRELVATTISVQLFVLPLLVYTSGFISLGGFIVNILVLPLVPTIMMLGFVTGILALGSTSLGFIPGVITYALLYYILWISQIFSKLPGSVISINGVSVYFPVFCYTAFGFIALYIQRKNLPQKKQVPA